MKYTPGPWRSGLHGYDGNIMSGKFAVASIVGGFGHDVQEANAHLIAAAPDLLSALEEAIEELDQCCSDAYGEDYNNPKFNAVLAKARGQS